MPMPMPPPPPYPPSPPRYTGAPAPPPPLLHLGKLESLWPQLEETLRQVFEEVKLKLKVGSTINRKYTLAQGRAPY